MALDEKSVDQQSHYNTSQGEHERFAPHFMAIHPIVVETFPQNHKCQPHGDA